MSEVRGSLSLQRVEERNAQPAQAQAQVAHFSVASGWHCSQQASRGLPLCTRGRSQVLGQEAGLHAGGTAVDVATGHAATRSHHKLVVSKER